MIGLESNLSDEKGRSIFYLFFLSLFFFSCITVKTPEIRSVESLKLQLQQKDPSVEALLVLYNPNPWGLKLKNLQATIKLNQQTLGIASLRQSIRIRRRSDVFVPVQIYVSDSDLLSALPSGLALLLGNSALPAELDGTFTLKKFIFKKTYPFKLRESIDRKRLK